MPRLSLSPHLLPSSSISCEIALVLGGDKGPGARNVLQTFYHIFLTLPFLHQSVSLPFVRSDMSGFHEGLLSGSQKSQETKTKHMKQVMWTIRPSFSSVRMITVPTEGVLLYFCLFIGCYRFIDDTNLTNFVVG